MNTIKHILALCLLSSSAFAIDPISSGRSTSITNGGATVSTNLDGSITQTTAAGQPLAIFGGNVRLDSPSVLTFGAQTAPAVSGATDANIYWDGAHLYLSKNGAAYAIWAEASGTVTGGSITWPGTIYSTPTTGSVASGTLTFAPSLANQAANTVFGNFTVSSATPTFSASPTFSGANLTGMTQSQISGLTSALSGKEPTVTAGTSAQYWRGDKTFQTLNQAAVAGLTTSDSPSLTGLTVSGGTITGGADSFIGAGPSFSTFLKANGTNFLGSSGVNIWARSDAVLGFRSGTTLTAGTLDTGSERVSAGVWGINTGTAGTSGTLAVNTIQAFGSATNYDLTLTPKGAGVVSTTKLTASTQVLGGTTGNSGQTTGGVFTGIYMPSGSLYTGSSEANFGANGMDVRSIGRVGFSSATTYSSVDTGLARNAVGTTESNSGTLGQFGQHKAGTIALQSIPTPAASPSAAVAGTAGTTTISYSYADCQADGSCTSASPAVTVTTANATLSAGNKVTLTFPALGANTTYRNVYRTATNGTSPTTTGKINASNVTTTTFDDTGLAGSGSAPTTNVTGTLAFTSGSNTYRMASDGFTLNLYAQGNTLPLVAFNNAGLISGQSLAFNGDTILARDAANTLAQRNSANAQTFNLYYTYTDASNYEKIALSTVGGNFEIGSKNAGTGAARNLILSSVNQLQFKIGGNVIWNVNGSGHFLANVDNTYDIGASGANRPRDIYAAGTVTATTIAATKALGTTTNDSAPTGYVGEYVSSTIATGSSVSLSTGTAANVTSVSLTAGDWDVDGVVDYTFAATTSYTQLEGSISTTSATTGSQDAFFRHVTPAQVPTAVADPAWSTPTVRISISGTTTVYLVAKATFTVSTLKAYGTLRARRVR